MRNAMRFGLLLFVFMGVRISLAQEKFEIVFMADIEYATDSTWITNIKQWGATGINLRIFRNNVETASHTFEWASVQHSIESIARHDLNIYLRANMMYFRREWPYSNDDFIQTAHGQLVLNPYLSDDRPLLSIASSAVRADMLRFLRELVAMLNGMPAPVRKRIKLIIPSITPDDETEYPMTGKRIGWGWYTGYSRPERIGFIKYLRRRYNKNENDRAATKLNVAWGSRFPYLDTNTVDINRFDWEKMKPEYKFFPRGRKDFIDYRASELKRFIDDCAKVVRAHYDFGVQFGSIYDEGVEMRHTYDVTSLLENVDCVINDDIAEYEPNFAFVADYMRSLCRYWDWLRKKRGMRQQPMVFGTETNNPGYNNIVPDTLVEYWRRQLATNYERGATLLYISHWGTLDGFTKMNSNDPPTPRVVAELVKSKSIEARNSDGSPSAYLRWRDILKSYGGLPVKKVKQDVAIHLSCEQTLYSREQGGDGSHIRNKQIVVGTVPTFDGVAHGTREKVEFPLFRFARSTPTDLSTNEVYNGNCDLVTNHMIANSATYVPMNYREFYLTETSYYMPDAVYSILSSARVRNLRTRGATRASDRSVARAIIPGSRNERNEIRNPAQLVARLRNQ